MFRSIYVLTSILFSAILLSGCGSNSSNSGAGPIVDRSAKTVYVDVANTGSADGTSSHPYKSVTAALSAGVAGDTIQIAAGNYETGETFPLLLKPGNVLIGAGRASTMIRGQIEDVNTGVNTPIVLRSLNAQGFVFGRDSARGAVTGANLIRQCEFGTTVEITHGGKHNFTIDSSTFQHGLEFKSGPGVSVNRVILNDISDTLLFSTGDGVIDSVMANRIVGGALIYKSGATRAYIAWNVLANSQLIDRSGAGDQIMQANDISFSTASLPGDSAAVLLKGVGATFTDNTVTMAGGNGIVAMSGSPTILSQNYVSASSGCGILTTAGAGQIVRNSVQGGTCGIYNVSGATLVEKNDIRFADTGLYSAGPAVIDSNQVSDCTGYAVILSLTTGPFQNNVVWDNLNGVRVVAGSPDLGGGSAGSVGLNILRHNTEFDLINNSTASVMAQHNYWDGTTTLDIVTADIYDKSDDASCGEVVFEPFEPWPPVSRLNPLLR
jgi:hypothetical protein